MSYSNQQKIIEQFQKETHFSFNIIDKFLDDNSLSMINEKNVNKAIKEHNKRIKEIDSIIPEKTGEESIWTGNKYNFVKDKKIPQYKTVTYYENGIAEKEVIKLKDELNGHINHIYYLDLLLRITKRFSKNVIIDNDEPEKNLTNNKSDFSDWGKLVKAIDRLVASEEFKALKIPKHDTLNSTHILNIKKLFKQQNPGKKINWVSFSTKLKSKYDYSFPRKK